MNLQEAEQELCRKLSINYSDLLAGLNDLFTQADLDAWINLGVLRAWDFQPWPFTAAAKTATTPVNTDYVDYPQDMVEGSAFLLKVGGLEYKKLLLEDYLLWFQPDQNPTATDRIWSEYKTFIFINKNAYNQGTDTFDLYGKLKAPTLASGTDLLPFSPTTDTQQYSGNEAIVQFAFSEALMSEKKKDPARAKLERDEAYATLELLWKPFADFRARQQSKNRPMFTPPDFFRKRFPTNNDINVGTFNW